MIAIVTRCFEKKLKLKVNQETSKVCFCQRSMGKHPLPGYGSVASGHRLVRTRMLDGVGAGGKIPPAARLGIVNIPHNSIGTKVSFVWSYATMVGRTNETKIRCVSEFLKSTAMQIGFHVKKS